jgi:hypothetical protein
VFLIFAAVALGLALAPTRFRKIGFAVAGTILSVFVILVLINRRSAPDNHAIAEAKALPKPESRRFDFDQYERDKKDKEDPDARTRIALSEVRFDQIKPTLGIDAGTIQAVRARLYNDSQQYTLTDYSYYLRVQDCLATVSGKAGECTTVYDQRGTVTLAVPPNQARDVEITIPKNSANFSWPNTVRGQCPAHRWTVVFPTKSTGRHGCHGIWHLARALLYPL